MANHDLQEVTICDFGGTTTYWGLFPFYNFPGLDFRIDLVNLDYRGDAESLQLSTRVVLNKLQGDACHLDNIEDGKYHLAHSNSVIEHVGGRSEMRSMAREMQRIADYYFLQTPNYWFPVEPHFLIPFYAWFPRPLRFRLQQWLRGKPDLDAAILADESVRLINRRQIRFLYPGGELIEERFIGITKAL